MVRAHKKEKALLLVLAQQALHSPFAPAGLVYICMGLTGKQENHSPGKWEGCTGASRLAFGTQDLEAFSLSQSLAWH